MNGWWWCKTPSRSLEPFRCIPYIFLEYALMLTLSPPLPCLSVSSSPSLRLYLLLPTLSLSFCTLTSLAAFWLFFLSCNYSFSLFSHPLFFSLLLSLSSCCLCTECILLFWDTGNWPTLWLLSWDLWEGSTWGQLTVYPGSIKGFLSAKGRTSPFPPLESVLLNLRQIGLSH